MDFLQPFEVITVSGAFAMFVWFVLRPLTALLIARLNGTDTTSEARLNKIEGNELHDISEFKARVYAMENRFDVIQTDFQKQLGKIGERLAILEERTRDGKRV